jgi:prepilin-type N-terminal cleavage/methylation domain-containing protein
MKRAARHGRRRAGFSLIEAIIALVLVLMIASVATGIYGGGMLAARQSIENQQALDAMRNQMELLLATQFASLANGQSQVTIGGRPRTLSWQVATIDIDDDGNVDIGAKQISVTLEGRTLRTLATDGKSMTRKL